MSEAHQTCCCGGGPECYRLELCPCPPGFISRGLQNLLEAPPEPGGSQNFARLAGLALRDGRAVVCDNGSGLPDGLQPGKTYISTIPPSDPDGKGLLGELCFTVTNEIVADGFDVGGSAVTEGAVLSECGDPACCEEIDPTKEAFVLVWCGPCELGDNLPAELITLYADPRSIPDGCNVVRVNVLEYFPNLVVNGDRFCYEVIRPSIEVPPDTTIVKAFACFDQCESILPDDSGCCQLPPEPSDDCRDCETSGCPDTVTVVVPALNLRCCDHDGTPIGFPCVANLSACNFNQGECPLVSTITFSGCGGAEALAVSPDCANDPASCGAQGSSYTGDYELGQCRLLCRTIDDNDVQCQNCTNWGSCGPTLCSDNPTLHPPFTWRWTLQLPFWGFYTQLSPSACPLGGYRFCRFQTPNQPPGTTQKIVLTNGAGLNTVTLVVV